MVTRDTEKVIDTLSENPQAINTKAVPNLPSRRTWASPFLHRRRRIVASRRRRRDT